MYYFTYLAKHNFTLFFRRILRRMFRNDNIFFAIQYFFKLFNWSLHGGWRMSARPIPPTYKPYKFKKPRFISVDESEIGVWIEKLDFCTSKPPKISILVPVYNNPKLLMECLVSLLATKEKDLPFEVVIADDCSPDERIKEFAKIKGLIYFRNSTNLGYIKNCNKAFTYASTSIIIFLNSDVIVMKKWLSPLVKMLESNNIIGAVGPMLINSDGSIQESGVILDSELKPNRIGYMDYPEDFSYSMPIKVDYCSGACLATKRDVFLAVSGFSEYLDVAYWDDVDYGLKLRKFGYSFWRVPESRVVHHENASFPLFNHNYLIEKNYDKIRTIWLGCNN